MSTVDPHSVEESRQQIRAIIGEIDQLGRTDLAEADFFRGLLDRVIEAMGAVGGLVWLVGDQGRCEPVCHAGVAGTGLAETGESQETHGKLVQSLLAAPHAMIVPARAQLAGPDGRPVAANPTDLLVIAAPLDRSGSRAGLLEVFHHHNQPEVEQGYLVFVDQVAAVANGYLVRRQVKSLDSQQAALVQVDRFSRQVHESLDPVATAFTLANEARRIIGCDRVSVLVRRGRRLRLDAVSGQESVERRATAVQAIEALARVVARARDPLWHPDPGRELPPQIEEELEHYIDESHATGLAILPLLRPRKTPVVKPGGVDAVAVAKAEAAPPADVATAEPIGVLVAEWFTSSSFDGGRRARVEVCAEHGAIALANSLDHTGLPLFRAIDLLGRSRVLTTARNLPRTVLAALGVLATAAALVFIPAELRLEGKGTLEPVDKRDVFAGVDGVVKEIAPEIVHGAVVKKGDLLLTMRNTDLEVAHTDVLGRKASSEEQLVSTRRALLEDKRISADERTRMAGRAAQLQREIESLEAQRKLYEDKRRELEVRSPIDGVVVTWQVAERLLLRPVEKGQVLLTVADKEGPWELELHLPDDRLGHVNEAALAARSAGRDLQVDYILATDPGTRHRGAVKEIHELAEVRGESGNVALVRVRIDPDRHERQELGAGASVTARIGCGRRSLGYVWFHDVLAFIQSQVLFRIF
ncbi:MAG: efflux RND transporter periplasmic adaptor subunit [Planctomycetaceae bacterium]